MIKRSFFLAAISLLYLVVINVSGQSRSHRSDTVTPATTQQTPDTTATDDALSSPSDVPVHKGKDGDKGTGSNSQDNSKPAREVGEDEVVRVSTTLVTLPVSVQDRQGRYIPDLHKQNFQIYENGVEQRVAYFAATDAPFTVALLIDTSSSTRFKLSDIQNAAVAFVDQLRPADRVIIISFADKIRVLSEATNDRNALRSAIRNTRGGGNTRFYEAVEFALQKMHPIEGRKAVVLFTDGVDTASHHSNYQGTLNAAEESDSLFYSLEYDTFSDTDPSGGSYPSGRGGGGSGGGAILNLPFPIPGTGGIPTGGGGRNPNGGGRLPGGIGGSSRADYERADQYLHEIADRTGGRFQSAKTIGDIDQAFSVIAEELRRQYSIGYYPKVQPTPGERRQIRVRLDIPNVVARTRENYVFGQQNAKQTGKVQTVETNFQEPK